MKSDSNTSEKDFDLTQAPRPLEENELASVNGGKTYTLDGSSLQGMTGSYSATVSKGTLMNDLWKDMKSKGPYGEALKSVVDSYTKKSGLQACSWDAGLRYAAIRTFTIEANNAYVRIKTS